MLEKQPSRFIADNHLRRLQDLHELLQKRQVHQGGCSPIQDNRRGTWDRADRALFILSL